jgi:hypothetical protein
MTGSAKPIIFAAGRMMGFASLYPSYATFHSLTVTPRRERSIAFPTVQDDRLQVDERPAL